MRYSDPEVCIDCGACVSAWPVEAMFADADVPEKWQNYIEINARGEAVITATNASILSPKLRYNLGDEAFVMSRPELVRRLVSLGVLESQRTPLPLGWASPFFFLYGRRDSTISYMGANIYPEDVEQALFGNELYGGHVGAFCLELREIGDVVEVLLPDRLIQPKAGSERPGQILHAALGRAHRGDFEQRLLDRIERQHGQPQGRAQLAGDRRLPGARGPRDHDEVQRAAISYGRGCLVSHCQNVRYGGRAMKWPLPIFPETSIRSTSGTSGPHGARTWICPLRTTTSSVSTTMPGLVIKMT